MFCLSRMAERGTWARVARHRRSPYRLTGMRVLRERKNAINSFTAFRVVFVSNHFEGL